MVNDSSTGGALLPDPSGPQPLEGAALNEFLQAWVVGMIGIDPTLVRPRWQAEPPNIPSAGEAWVAFGVRKRPNDTYVFNKHMSDADNGEGADLQLRHETLDILASFYDLGVGGQADYLVSLLKDGIQVAQNREILVLNGYGVVEASEPTAVPSLLNERWLYRVDLGITLRRQTQRKYLVRNVLGLTATVLTSEGPSVAVVINPSSPSS